MDLTDFATVENLGILIAVIIAAIAGTSIYIVVNAPKKAKKTAILYMEWAEALELPGLTNNPTLNSKAIEKFFKLVWPKKYPEELDVRQELQNLTQKLALDFTQAANIALQPKKSPVAFIYDAGDAEGGFLRLFSVLKTSREYKLFYLSQGLLALLKEAYKIAEFSYINIADDVDPGNIAELKSFIVSGSGFPTDDFAAGEKAMALLGEKLDGVWLATEVSDDVISFRRQTEEDLQEEKAIPVESNPFKARIEAKRMAEAEKAAQRESEKIAREEAWRDAEAKRIVQETAARESSIASGSVSKYVADPLRFLAGELEIAADATELFTLDDEPEIMKTDGIGSPILFCIYSNDVIEPNDPRIAEFSRLIIASLDKNLGNHWMVEFADTSLTFRRGL